MPDSRTTKFKVGDMVRVIHYNDIHGWNCDIRICGVYRVVCVVDETSSNYGSFTYIRLYISKRFSRWALPVSCLSLVGERQLLFPFMYEEE